MKTYNAGANDERTSIIAKVRRVIKKLRCGPAQEELETLLEWLLTRNERYNKRKGGLGK